MYGDSISELECKTPFDFTITFGVMNTLQSNFALFSFCFRRRKIYRSFWKELY